MASLGASHSGIPNGSQAVFASGETAQMPSKRFRASQDDLFEGLPHTSTQTNHGHPMVYGNRAIRYPEPPEVATHLHSPKVMVGQSTDYPASVHQRMIVLQYIHLWVVVTTPLGWEVQVPMVIGHGNLSSLAWVKAALNCI